ncbi:tectonic-like complex member MKS1 isoform X2 [Anabrus simplex]|uniref:tectonic-like complex member MKS1 isoform X2 n=1 Tax=Anabrus simplex TaxID=316456 RepID=UPI0035A2E710
MSRIEESDFTIGVYRCPDPIKNFKIRVKLKREKSSSIPLPNFEPGGGGDDRAEDEGEDADDDSEEIEERTFSWQEKVFSPFEMSYYIYPGNCHTPLEEMYHEKVTKLCEGGKPANRLFTYTEADNYGEMQEGTNSITTDVQPPVTPLVKGMLGVRRRKAFTVTRQPEQSFPVRDIIDPMPDEDRKKKTHYIQSSIHNFYIVADLCDRDSEDTDDWTGRAEYVLCKIQYDFVAQVLTITPDFTSTSVTGKMLPFRIEVGGDARNLYHYWLEHASEDLPQEEKERDRALLTKMLEHELNMRQAQVGTEFVVPYPGYLQVHILGEVVSAAHFEYDHLFVHYFFELPIGWSCNSSEELSGVTQRCRRRSGQVANFCYLFETCLTLNLEVLHSDVDVVPKWPQLFVEVISLDSWERHRTEGYGYINLPSVPGSHQLTVSTWRPLSDSVRGEMRRFFLGGSPELQDPTYPSVPANFDVD